MASDSHSALPGYPGRKAGALTFSLLFTLESLVRSLNASVISIQAYELLGSARNVSIVTTLASVAVLVTTLLLPFVLRRTRRRWAYTLGIAISMAAALALASHTVVGQAAGYYFRQAGATIMGVTLSLYILDHIHKSDYARVEPIRLSFSTFAWTLGPSVGIWLYSNYGPVAAQLSVFIASLTLLGVFWFLRLADDSALHSGTLQPFNPLQNVSRFVAQSRLRLAWSIAFGRSVFWAALFTYGPILILESGMTQQMGGYLISASQIILPVALIAGWLGRRHGVRPVIAGSFALIAICAGSAGLVGTANPVVMIVLLLFAALGASGLDGVGAIPFMRAVKARERREMTSVYRTFIEVSDILPGFVFALLLTLFSTSVVFIVVSALALFMAFMTWRHLPKSL
jgi:MFS family permease